MFKLNHNSNTNTIIKSEDTKPQKVNVGSKVISQIKPHTEDDIKMEHGYVVIDNPITQQPKQQERKTNLKLNNTNNMQTVTHGLNISIKTMRTKINVPFIVRPTTDGSLTLVLDELVLSTLLEEQPIVTKVNEKGEIVTTVNEKKVDKRNDPFSVIQTIEEFLALPEFPASLIQHIDISELEVISQPEQILTKYITNIELRNIIEAFINEKKSLEDEAKRNNTTCKSCTIGSLNRRYLLKCIPLLPGYKSRVEFYKDINNTLRCETETKSSQFITNESLRKINDSYFVELKAAESKPGCTQCMKNGIKIKYQNALSDLIRSNRDDLLQSYEQ